MKIVEKVYRRVIRFAEEQLSSATGGGQRCLKVDESSFLLSLLLPTIGQRDSRAIARESKKDILSIEPHG